MTSITLVHPAIAAVAVFFCYINASMGLSRYGIKVISFRRNVHINIGRTFLSLLFLSYPLGLYGISLLGLRPFTTPHSYLGAVLLGIFSTGVFFAFLVLKGNMKYVKLHGRIMIAGAIILIFQIISGIGNLRNLLGLF